jgi:outer membrane protein insertion porin family
MLAALLSLILGSAASSQGGQPSPDPIVQEITVEAPGSDVERLRRYITVRRGAPLRRTEVRESVELLHATGAFADVIVETEPLDEGLQVTFRLIAAPRLSGILVEGDQVLEAGALKRITGLTKREALWQDRLDRAARDAALALADRGYLEARVTAEARPTAGGSQAVFTVHAGHRAHVRRLSLEGFDTPGIWALERRMRPGAGKPYDRRQAEAAAEAIRRELVDRGRWKAGVEIRSAYDPRFARVDLTFVVDAGLLIRLELLGDPVPGTLYRETEKRLRDGRVQTDALEEARDRLEEHLLRRGHRDAVVSYREEPRPGMLAVVYDVDAGPRATAASVRIQGDHPPLTLRSRTTAPVEDRLLEEDAAALSQALEDLGHIAPRVEVDVGEGGGQLPVVFYVRAGPRTLVRSYQVVAEPMVQLDSEPGGQRIQVGDPYRIRDLARDRRALLTRYRNAGYLQAEVEPDVVFADDLGEAEITLRVRPGPRTDIDRIVIAGLERTREAVVRRELTIREGEPLGLQNVLDSQRRLGALGIFSRVEIRELDPEARSRTLVILAEEAPRTTVAYGLGYGTRELLRASAEVTRRNLGGTDQSLTVFARGSFRGSRFFTTYRTPYLLGHKRELFITAFREQDDRESFDFIRYGALVQSVFRLTPRSSAILRYSFQETDTFNEEVPCGEVDRQFCDSTVSGPSASLVNDSRDDPLEPRRGHFLGADVQLSLDRLGGDSSIKGFFQASYYAPALPRVLLALNGRLGLARTLGTGEPLRLPLPERFFAGGDYSLRGFEVDAVAPEGGNALVLGGAELRVDVGHSISVAAFGELGNVYTLVSDVDRHNLRYTAGLGLRYRSALGPLRIDWGYKLNRRPGESPSRWHFTIGHAF